MGNIYKCHIDLKFGDSVPRTVNRSIHFYKINFENGGAKLKPDQISKVFSTIDKMSFDETGRYLPLGDGNMRSIYVDSANFPIKARVGTIRRTGLPDIEERGKISPLNIAPNAGLFEPTHFMIFDNNVAAFEYNFYGPRPGSLKYYIPKKLVGIDKVDLMALFKPDTLDILNKIGEIKLFELRVHRNMGQLLKNLHESLYDCFSSLKKASNSQTLTIILANEKHSRKPIRLKFRERLYEWLQIPGVREGVESIQIKGRNMETDQIEWVDLLQQFLIAEKRVIKQKDGYRAVDSEDMYRAIEQAYNELKDDINQVINTDD